MKPVNVKRAVGPVLVPMVRRVDVWAPVITGAVLLLPTGLLVGYLIGGAP